MGLSAEDCSEEANSTDCLLRVLLSVQEEWSKREDDEFNWDPVTFGFTVAIAAFAALFALLAVVQASLASGASGRRKTDKRALGHWAQMTESQWKWFSFSPLYTTVTPMITTFTITVLLERLSEQRPKSFKSLLKQRLKSDIVHPSSRGFSLMLMHIKSIFLSVAVFLAYPVASLKYGLRKRVFRNKNQTHLYSISRTLLAGFNIGVYELMVLWVPLVPLLFIWPIWILYLTVSTPFFIANAIIALTAKYHSYKGLNPLLAGAAWVGFLSEVLLGQIPPDAFAEIRHVRRKTANYLPDDLLAVHADGEVGVIITLLAMYGDRTKFVSSPSSNLPSLVARNYRFQILEHSILGTVGVFQSHEMSTVFMQPRSTESQLEHLRAVQAALDYAQGTTRPRNASPCFGETSRRPGHLQDDEVFELFNSPTTANEQETVPWLSKRPLVPPWVFLFEHMPEEPPPVYPRVVMDSSHFLPALIAGSSFWRSRKFATALGDTLSTLLGRPLIPKGFDCWLSDYPREEMCNVVFYGCTLLAFDMTRFDTWLKGNFSLGPDMFRIRVQELVEVLDTWVQEFNKTQPDVPFRAVSLVLRARGFLNLGQDLGYDESKGGGGLHQALASYFHKKRTEERQEDETIKQRKTKRRVVLKVTRRRAKKRQCSTDIVPDDQLRRVVEQFAVLPKYVEFQKRNRFRGSLSDLLPILAQRFTAAEEGMAGDEYDPSDEQRIEDVLIFRCLLMTMLFRTALDNSDLLKSGAWGQVIPLL